VLYDLYFLVKIERKKERKKESDSLIKIYWDECECSYNDINDLQAGRKWYLCFQVELSNFKRQDRGILWV
jgi:hypothetical protein